MKQSIKILASIVFVAQGLHAQNVQWQSPSGVNEFGELTNKSELEKTPYGKMVIYGHELVTKTPRYLGQEAKDESNRLLNSNLSCASCHANAGTKKDMAPFVGLFAKYPVFMPNGMVITLDDRINACMTRSVNAKPLSKDSKEIKAIQTYIQFLSRGVKVGDTMQGQGYPDEKMPDRKPDVKNGQIVYQKNCVACHRADGQGVKNPDKSKDFYIYPALWGEHSYNDGAGMHQQVRATKFIKANMPKFNAHLSIDDAYDVAAYINSKPRPKFEQPKKK